MGTLYIPSYKQVDRERTEKDIPCEQLPKERWAAMLLLDKTYF